MTSLSDIRDKYNQVVGRLESLEKRRGEDLKRLLFLEQESELLEKVSTLLRSLIDREVLEGVSAIEDLQTEAMRVVFPDQENSVRAETTIKRGKVDVSLVTERKFGDLSVEGSALESFGGALATVQSVILRIAVILKRGMRPLLVLDESLPAIEGEYVQRMAKFLSALCERVGMDILLVTHDPMLVDVADRAYRISLEGGEAKLTLTHGD